MKVFFEVSDHRFAASGEGHIRASEKDCRESKESNLSLADSPYQGSRKLRGLGTYRVRVGDYRIIYDVEDAIRILTVIRVPHRKDAYR